jgi:Family of unknown function (DUF5675)
MQLRVDRVESDGESTLGRLHIDGVVECWTLEDQFRRGPKVKGETRIPAGKYQLKLREEGGFHIKYLEKYGPEWHRGVLHVTNVPGFEFILIHVGNSHDDTEGCLLVGQGQSKVDGFHYVTSSRQAYEALYPKVRDALLGGATVEIEYVDLDPASQAALPPIAVATSTVGAATVINASASGGPTATGSSTNTSGAAQPSTNKPATTTSDAGKDRTGVVAGATAVAGAAVAGVGGMLVAGEDAVSTPTNAGGVAAAPPSGGLMERIADPDNLLKVVLIGLGVIVVVCAIYFIMKRINRR